MKHFTFNLRNRFFNLVPIMKGAVILQNSQLKQGDNRILNRNIVKGSYVLIISVDGQSYTKKIVIQ